MTDPSDPVEPAAPVRRPLSRDEYLAERKELYKYQQENWANFEKTLLTLSSGFLAFSMSFLAFLARPRRAIRSLAKDFCSRAGSPWVSPWRRCSCVIHSVFAGTLSRSFASRMR